MGMGLGLDSADLTMKHDRGKNIMSECPGFYAGVPHSIAVS